LSTYEKYQSARYERPGEIESYSRSTFGLTPDALERHMRVMNDLQLPGGSISRADKRWLLDQAKAAGRDVGQAAQMIAHVEAIPDPQRRALSYVVASGAPRQDLINHAMEMSKVYSVEWGASLAEDRLNERDAQNAKAGTQFRFDDTPELKRSRHEATAVRRTIEAALEEKGLTPPPAQSLEEEQHRAKKYASAAADRMEATPTDAPIRDHIEAAWTADQAFNRLRDTGVKNESMSDVMDRTDANNFAARSIDG
jgi:hypothetical protein